MRISVVGLGKLGAPLAIMLAADGHTVIGVDTDQRVVDSINQGTAPGVEPGVDEMLAQARNRLSATRDCVAAVANSSATFVLVPTPSDASGSFSSHQLQAAVEVIGKGLRHARDFHLVVVRSTVMPGTMERTVVPALETHSGRRCGQDFGLCFAPEFVALGSVVHDLRHPGLILIGESDPHSGDLLSDVFRGLSAAPVPVVRMNFVNAELTKLAINTFVTTKISFANMLAQVCERLPGADVAEVTAAVGLDARIGAKCLTGALGYGGPCFPRDNLAFARMAEHVGVDAVVSKAAHAQNDQQLGRLVELVLAKLPDGGRVAILGLAFKPNTDVVDAAPGLLLARELAARGIAVVAHDPAAMVSARAVLGDRVAFAESVADCTRQAAVVVVATPWEQFRALSPAHLCCDQARPVVVDAWRLFEASRFAGVADYVALGVGPRA